jgi:N-acetylmuramoyl-L-alanine amidase
VATFLLRVSPDTAPVGRFAVGDSVAVAVDGGNLRNGPGLDFSVAFELPLGTPGLVIVGPHVVDGYVWYQLDTPTDIGWMADSILAPADELSPPAGTPIIGDTVVVATDWLRLREGPGTSYSVAAVLPEGTTGTVIDGPRAADGHTWCRLETESGTGWGAAEFLALDGDATGTLRVGGMAVVATDALRVRSEPTTDGDILEVILDGTTLDIVDGPITADGYTWWKVANPQIGSGWCVSIYLGSG